MDKLLNVRTNWRHSALEYLIKQEDFSQDMSRSAVFEREVDAAINVENWREIQIQLSELKRNEEIPVFTNLQVRYTEETEEKLQAIRDKIFSDLEPFGIKRLQTQYFLLLLEMNYLISLKREKKALSHESSEVFDGDLTIPELSSTLMEMVLYDRDSEELDKIKQIMIEWKKQKKRNKLNNN